MPEHRLINKHSFPQSCNTVGSYTLHHCSPMWAVIHHMILLCISYQKTIIKMYIYWYVFTKHYLISLVCPKSYLENYGFWTLELFRHVIIILCPGSHHHEDGHMRGRSMTVITVQTFTSIYLLKTIDYLMHQQINIQQLYTLSTLYLCVLCLSEN